MECSKMQTWLVDLIVFVVVAAVFLIAVRGIGVGWGKESLAGFRGGSLGKFFDLFWGWADYKPQDWSNAPYKRGYR
jgi:hypothetical protein